MNDKTKSYILAWLNKADSDLKNAKLVFAAGDEAPPYDTICFHCQQAVEKYLKAFLVYHDISFPYSHNLSDLAAACIQVDKSFASIQREAETLTPYAVEIRYPDDFYMPTKDEAREAYETASKIREFVLARMDEDFRKACR